MNRVPDRREPLLRAVEDGLADEALAALQSGVCVHRVLEPDDGKAAIHIAAEMDDLQILRLLIDHEANVNQRDYDGNTPLHYAALTDHIDDNNDVVRLLVEKGADVIARSWQGATPLLNAAFYGSTELVKFLASHPRVNLEDYPACLHAACSIRCQLATIQFLGDRLPSRTFRQFSPQGDLPLHCACSCIRLSAEVVQYLVKRFPGAVELQNLRDRANPLSLILNQHISILKWLNKDKYRTILSIKNLSLDDRETSNWDCTVALLWYHYFGADNEEEPPRIADTRRLPDKEYKKCYQWMIYAACSLIHMEGRLLKHLYNVYEPDTALEPCAYTGKTPLITVLQTVQRQLRHYGSPIVQTRFENLVDWSPAACRIRDINNRLPLAYAIEAKLSWRTIQKMVKAWPLSAVEKDTNGREMFKLAAAKGSLSVIYLILRCGALVKHLADTRPSR